MKNRNVPLRIVFENIINEYDMYEDEDDFYDALRKRGIIYKPGWLKDDPFVTFYVSLWSFDTFYSSWYEWQDFYVIYNQSKFGGAKAELFIPKGVVCCNE